VPKEPNHKRQEGFPFWALPVRYLHGWLSADKLRSQRCLPRPARFRLRWRPAVTIYGPYPAAEDRDRRGPISPPAALRSLFVACSSKPTAQALLDRFTAAPISSRSLQVFTRTGLEYDRDPAGNYISAVPDLEEPIKAELGMPLPPRGLPQTRPASTAFPGQWDSRGQRDAPAALPCKLSRIDGLRCVCVYYW